MVGFSGHVGAKGAHAVGDGGGGIGLLFVHDLLQIGQLVDLAVGAVDVAVDAQFFYAGLLAVDGDLPGADGGMGGAVVAAALVLWQGWVVAGVAGDGAVFAGEAATDGGVAGFEAGVVFYVCEGEAVGGELVVLFGSGGGDGAALQVDAIGADVVAVFAGKEAGLLVDGVEVAGGVAAVDATGCFPHAAKAALYVDVGTALADFLVYLVLWADDAEFAADVGIYAVGIGLSANQGGIAFAGQAEFV
nr:hypothetical protein [Snodgrassella sp.]